jgi:Endonuclease/Exonuclease/phosphatase family.
MNKGLRVGTWNVLSLHRSGALHNLIQGTQEYKTDLLAVQEVRWLGRSIIKRRIAEYTIVVMIDNKFLEQAILLVTTSDHV